MLSTGAILVPSRTIQVISQNTPTKHIEGERIIPIERTGLSYYPQARV